MSLVPVSTSPLATASLPRVGSTSSAANAKATEGSNDTGTSSTDAIGSTFLSLLVQELQNQDPTAPMDSTAMVGQMISLNQLNQLTSINQVLNTAYGTTKTAASNATDSGSSSKPNALSTAQAALRLLNNVSATPAVSNSVTLPSLPTNF